MGQCQCCHGLQQDAGKDASQRPHSPFSNKQQHFDTDSALDSTHSSGDDDPSYEPGKVSAGQSTKSPGKYSLRESIASCVDCAQAEFPLTAIDITAPGVPSSDDNDDSTEDASDAPGRDSLTPLRDVPGLRTSRGSSDSERGSVSPAASVKRGLKATLGRSLSLKLQRTTPRADVLNSSSWVGYTEAKQHQRSVSLRLPRTSRRPRNFSTKLPTIYVDDAELRDRQQQEHDLTRKISLNHALSLLSVNSFARQETQKPVQKILRQPRRRHNTVRGLSGMAIGASNQASLHRYYPTSTSRRHFPRPTSTLDY